MTSQATSAQNTLWYISSAPVGSSPNGFVRILEITSFNSDGSRSESDVTSLDSTAKEFRSGLQDFGTFTLEMIAIFDDPGQLLLDAARASPSAYDFKIVYPDNTTDTFRALVNSFPRPTGAVDEVLRRTAAVRVTGNITTVVG